jgi:hypothetical protein
MATQLDNLPSIMTATLSADASCGVDARWQRLCMHPSGSTWRSLHLGHRQPVNGLRWKHKLMALGSRRFGRAPQQWLSADDVRRYAALSGGD